MSPLFYFQAYQKLTSFPNEPDEVDRPWTVPDLTQCSPPAQTGGPTDVCVSHLQQTGKIRHQGFNSV